MNTGYFARPLPRCLLFKKHRETPSEPTVPPNSDPFMAEVVAQLEKQLESERKELAYARLKIQVLEEQLRQQRIAQYGPGSEKLSNLQLELLDEEPAVSRDEVQAESEREPGAPPPAHIGQRSNVHRILAARACRRICRAWKRWPRVRPRSVFAPAAEERQR